MIRPSRRIFAYWAVLLVATLAVGGAAWLLLSREQERLAERAGYADSARRAALQSRLQLTAENVELLISDAQNALLDTLTEVPEAEALSFVQGWSVTNPLVRMGFLATGEGRLVQPRSGAGTEEERGFVRRFADVLLAQPPWASRLAEPEVAPRKQAPARSQLAEETLAEQRQVQENRIRVDSARREVRNLSKARTSSAVSASADSPFAQAREGGVVQASPAGDYARGWHPLQQNGRLSLIGWVRVPGEEHVRGVELNLVALTARLGGVLPSELADGEGLVLRNHTGLVLHQVGDVPGEAVGAMLQVPLATTLMPGWTLEGFLQPGAYRRESSAAFVWIGSLLVLILVLVILSAGSLLLWQARRSETEALQKTSFVANVSHEFKTPLTTIRLYSELLEQGRVRDEGKQREYLATIGRETQRLGRLVNNALDFSRLEQGRKKYNLEAVKLGEEVSRILTTLQPRLAEVGIEAELVISEPTLKARMDRDAFEQVVLNLVDNACKYAAEGKVLQVSVGRSSHGAEVAIADRGPGVPPEHRERVFEKFHRVNDTLTAEKTGAGLGLSIARRLLHGMGGDIRCEARNGGGTVFVILLS